MARKSGQRQPSKYGSPHQPRPSGSLKGTARPLYSSDLSTVPALSTLRSQAVPVLWIVGVFTVVASVVGSCSDEADDDPGVTVRRASYASLADCEADWSMQGDCENVPIDSPGAIFHAQQATAGGGTPAFREAPSPHAGSLGYSTPLARWYGPYYTASGTVYHANGTQTRHDMSGASGRWLLEYDGNGSISRKTWVEGAPRSAMIEEATVRRSALGRGRSMGLSMPMAAATQGPVISRGGFTSRFGGSSGRSGGG